MSRGRLRKSLSRSPLSPERLFDRAVVRDLWAAGRSRSAADMEKLRVGLVRAARAYDDAIGRRPNALHDEINALWAAAASQRFEQAATALERLTPTATELLQRRPTAWNCEPSWFHWTSGPGRSARSGTAGDSLHGDLPALPARWSVHHRPQPPVRAPFSNLETSPLRSRGAAAPANPARRACFPHASSMGLV